MAGGGETEKDISAWTVDSTREETREIFALRDRVDWWRDRLYDERERHREKLDALVDKMLEQRFQASEQALAVDRALSGEKFAGFPEVYALKGETNQKIAENTRAISDLVSQSQTRSGSETAITTQRTERRLSTNVLLSIGLFLIAVLTVVVPLFNR